MAKTSLNNLQRLADVMNAETLTKKDFLKSAQSLVQVIKNHQLKTDEALEQVVRNIERKYDRAVAAIGKAQKEATATTVKNLEAQFKDLEKDIRNLARTVENRANSLRDGRDADVEEVVARVAALIPDMPELEIPQEMTDQLEANTQAIERLEKEIREASGRRRVGGGGTSAIGVRYAIGKTAIKETPSGAIDGANTTYTTSRTVNLVLSFIINGQAISDDEYTIAGNTITLNTALPAAFDGKSFRIVYV